MRNLNEDIISEDNCEPDIKVDLYSLDVKKINEAYEQFCADDKTNWSVFGSTFFHDESARNCSGLVGFLLYKGEITNLVECPELNLAQGTGSAKRASKWTVPILTSGVIASHAKAQTNLSSVKIAVTAKLTLFSSVHTFAHGASLTPNDIADIAEQAYKAEQEKLSSLENNEQPNTQKLCSIL